MIAPGVRHRGFHVPRALSPFPLGVAAVVLVVLAWGALTLRHTANRTDYAVGPDLRAATVRSVAYSVPDGGRDRIFVRESSPGAIPRLVTSFPYSFNNLHARGSASPTADRLAVLHMAASSSSYARLALVTLPGGSDLAAAGDFDYLSSLAWSPDGARVAATRSEAAGEAGLVRAVIVEVDAASGAARDAAVFDAVFEAAPVGYSIDGERLFVVVIDPSGSTLWAVRNGRPQKVAALSPGRTLAWALSPDGSRLAYIDVLGAGERTYAGRTLLIATGRVVDTPSFDDQLGVAWLPGSEVPVFGGPGGSVRLSADAREDGYVVPQRWSPDGSTLVATIYPASGDRAASRSGSIELISSQQRIRLSAEPGSGFLGWVRDVE